MKLQTSTNIPMGTIINLVAPIPRSLEPLVVAGAPFAYAIVEVGTVLAEWFLKKREEKGERRAEQLAIEADRQRRPGESLKEAMDRLRAEKRS